MLTKVSKRLSVITRLAFLLGMTFGSTFALWQAGLRKLISKRTHRTDTKEYALKLKFNGTAFDYHLSNYEEYVVLKEVFLDREYEITLDETPRVVFDFGAHVGASVIYLRTRYPNAKIHAFEPDPHTFEKLKIHAGQFDGISVHNIAVSPKDGVENFYTSPEASLSSSLKQRSQDQDYIEVKCSTIDSLIRDLHVDHVDLIKIDIEGSEFDVLRTFKGIGDVKCIIGELHLDLIDQTKEEFLALLNEFDVECKSVAKDRYIFKAKRKSRESQN